VLGVKPAFEDVDAQVFLAFHCATQKTESNPTPQKRIVYTDDIRKHSWGIRVMPETTAKPRKRAAKPSNPAAEAQVPATPAKLGKPTKYTPEIARIICEQLSDGIPLRQICRENKGFPAWRTVYDWMGKDEALSAAIARARDIGYDAIAEECLLIADTVQYGQKQVMTDQGTATTVEDMLGHRKLQIETRLKLLAKFHPSKYGDKVGIHGVAGAAPISTEDTSASRLFEIIKHLEMSKRAGA
jgi:hypothetical protein